MSTTRPAKTGLQTVRPAKVPAPVRQLPDDQLGPAAQRFQELATQYLANAQQAYKTNLRRLGNQLGPAAQRATDSGVPSSANTQRSYSADLRSYETFCTQHQFTPYPADLATLTGYLTHLTNQQKKLATIHHHLAAIQRRHRLSQLSSVIGTPALNDVLRGIAEKLGTQQRRAPAFTVEHLKRCIAQLDLDTAPGLRDRAILLMGFAGAFRRSELVALNMEDFMFVDECLIIRISHSKTIQNRATEEKALFYAENTLFCPITAYKQWIERLDGRLSGPVFVSIQRGRTPGTGRPSLKRLTDRTVNKLVHKHLGEFAENVPYTAQSLRASFIMVAKLAGQNDDFIMNQTNHKTNAFSARYAGLAPVVKRSTGNGLGL